MARSVAFLVAMAMGSLGVRESESSGPTSCSERVALVLDNVYGRYFARQIDQLFMNDPFAMLESNKTTQDFMKRLRKSMLYHCQFYESRKACDGVRNARFQERFGKNNERVFPKMISPKDPSCFKITDLQGPQRDRCAIVQCYRELVEKNCRAVVERKSEVEEMHIGGKCV